LLIALMLLDRFSLVRSLNMFFIGLALALIWSTFVLRPSFASFQKYVGSLWSDLKSYGVHVYLSNIWNETLLYADKFIISIFLPVQSLAYYYLGYALTIPLSHFSNALATTMFNRFASQDRIDSRVTRVNILFVVSSVSIFIVLRRFIIVSLFSAEYLPTVDLMLPLALAFGFSGLSKPFTLFLMARGAGKTVRNISIAVPTINIVLGILIIPRFEIMGAAWVQTVVLFCDLLLFFLAYRKFTGVRSA